MFAALNTSETSFKYMMLFQILKDQQSQQVGFFYLDSRNAEVSTICYYLKLFPSKVVETELIIVLLLF